jgi:DNA-binding transcriptional ArsR family regulator/DNA-binding PadR family transcriptional regulator
MDADIAAIAALIGDPARANMLLALMGGLSLPAGELAMCANISPQTASSHLSKLLQAKLLSIKVQGRHRYYRLARPEVGSALESLLVIALPGPSRVRRESEQDNPLRFARSCYSHLAGRVAVEMNEAFQKRGLLVTERSGQYRLTEQGRRWFEKFGIDPAELKASRSGFARECLDWTERRHHLAGALGTVLLDRLFTLKWVVRVDKTRVVRVTHKGREELRKLLGIEFSSKF